MTDNKEPQTGFSIDTSIARDFRQQLDSDVRDGVRECFNGCEREDEFIEQLKVEIESWFSWCYGPWHDDDTPPAQVKKIWGDMEKALGKFQKAVDALPHDQQLLLETSTLRKALQDISCVRGSIKNHLIYLGGVKSKKGRKPNVDLHTFVEAIVSAYIKTFKINPHYSRDATDVSFVCLVHNLADSHCLSPPNLTSLEKYIGPAIKAARADFPDVK